MWKKFVISAHTRFKIVYFQLDLLMQMAIARRMESMYSSLLCSSIWTKCLCRKSKVRITLSRKINFKCISHYLNAFHIILLRHGLLKLFWGCIKNRALFQKKFEFFLEIRIFQEIRVFKLNSFFFKKIVFFQNQIFLRNSYFSDFEFFHLIRISFKNSHI